MVLFKYSMANRQMRFDMCDNYPNALGKCFTMLSLAGRPTRLSSIFQRPENRVIYYVVSWDISIFFFIVQSILWHDNGSINPRRQSDKWWELRFWSWWWLLRQLIHKVNTIMNCKFHFISECIYVFQILNHDGTSHFCFQILRIHNRPHIFFDLTDHTKIHWWGKREQCESV